MSVPHRAPTSFDAAPAAVAARSPAMQAVEHAWRNQYSDLRQARASAANAVSLAEAAEDSHALAHALFQSAYAAIRVG